MIRRQFLKHLAVGLPSLPLIFRGRDEYVHPLYGKYVSHHCDRTVEYMVSDAWVVGGELRARKDVLWPIEVTLAVEFDKARLSYTGFNASRDLCDRINLMRPEVLLKDADGGELVFADRDSCVREFCPGFTRFLTGRPIKFVVREVAFRGKS